MRKLLFAITSLMIVSLMVSCGKKEDKQYEELQKEVTQLKSQLEYEHNTAKNLLEKLDEKDKKSEKEATKESHHSEKHESEAPKAEKKHPTQVTGDGYDGFVAVREYTTSSSYCLTNLYNGERATYLGRSGNWYKVRHNGCVGYVYKKYAKLIYE